jgi:hypothetical protein
MGLLCTVEETLDSGGHEYRVLGPDVSYDWLKELAEEYINLRTACARPLSEISVDGIGVLSTENLLKRLKTATVPVRRADNFDVVRSDFGEVLSYLLLERHYGVSFGYKSVRDREIAQSPGRGIDALGIEDGEQITLVLGETKVSADKVSPPGVVDKSDDCLSRQHVGHISDLQQTAKKIWDTARRVPDPDLRAKYMTAAFLLEDGHIEKLKIIGCCTLVRPTQHYTIADFGSFRKNPSKYMPAQIRFLIVRLADGIEEVVKQWYEIVQDLEVAA